VLFQLSQPIEMYFFPKEFASPGLFLF